LASVLEARPGARVEACGFAVPGEIDKGSADDLLALAQARASAVKQRLADGGKIAAGRIFECRAILDELPGATPRVETKFQ
jgi:outer membrane protein OmpA-like peptidoglycan-associated protein